MSLRDGSTKTTWHTDKGHACVFYFCTCTCSAKLSMFHMEKRSRNTLIITIIIIIMTATLSNKLVPNRWIYKDNLTYCHTDSCPTNLSLTDGSTKTTWHTATLRQLSNKLVPNRWIYNDNLTYCHTDSCPTNLSLTDGSTKTTWHTATLRQLSNILAIWPSHLPPTSSTDLMTPGAWPDDTWCLTWWHLVPGSVAARALPPPLPRYHLTWP